MEKQVREWLPQPESMNDHIRSQAKPIEPENPSVLVKDQSRKFLQKENANAGNANRLDGARKVSADVEAVAVAARKGAHGPSLKARRRGVKRASGREREERVSVNTQTSIQASRQKKLDRESPNVVIPEAIARMPYWGEVTRENPCATSSPCTPAPSALHCLRSFLSACPSLPAKMARRCFLR